MSNTDGEDTQKVSLGELLLNAGTRIVDLEKQSNDQVEIITHLEKELASLREQLASEQEQSKKYLSLSLDYRNQIQQKEEENRELKGALNDIIKFCGQFELSQSKRDTLNEYEKLLTK